MPLGQGRKTQATYHMALGAHAFGSVISGAIAGGIAGLIGSYLRMPLSSSVLWMGMASLSVTLALREFGWVRFPVPQVPRQTAKMWRARFGPVGAAWRWGLDLGSGLTTFVTFSGYWLVLVAVIVQGVPIYGASVIGLFGLGRALAVTIVPMLLDREEFLPTVLHDLWHQRTRSLRWHGYGLLALGLGLFLQAARLIM